MQRSLFEGKPNLLGRPHVLGTELPPRPMWMKPPQNMIPISAVERLTDMYLPDAFFAKTALLRSERESLIERIRPGKAGVKELRVRLKMVTHQLLKLELELSR